MAKQQPWRWIYVPPLCLLLLLAGIETSDAEPKAAVPGGDAIKKAQGLIRQLSQEKQALEAEKAAWLNEKAGLEAKLKSLEAAVAQLAPLQGEVARYKNGLEAVKTSLESQLSQQRQREQALVQKHNDVVAKARAIRDDNQLLVQAVQEREQWIGQCGQLNQQLRELNQKVVEQYEQKGLWQQLAELEPLTGIAKVDSQNRAEAYRYQLKQLKVTPFEAGAALAAGQAAAEPAQEASEPIDTATRAEPGADSAGGQPAEAASATAASSAAVPLGDSESAVASPQTPVNRGAGQ
ncbi:hypothetical protein [Methylomonas koyamae]|uniref:hypothetical protein n=1 Tax=Methylomonas koyamae TaxID=702114 RepID=UPI001C321DBB|nr:hypothetical protein [Methylomonas koyamae]BBL58468.1 hypothetical protein MKFW12EY_20810 [Methylomonas koyamae]BBL60593.1 hypothetical protein MKFW12EY_42060 [Methylomonas koyamae]